MLRKFGLGAAVLAIAGLVGCGTVITGTTHDMSIKSTPTAASVRVVDETGAEVFTGSTPASVTLSKKKGFFAGKSYTVTIEQAGFEPVEVSVKSRVNGWYVAGNFLIGGLIGWLVVDPLTGGMWTFEPDEIDHRFGDQVSFADGSQISVVLLEQVPQDIRDRMVPVN